MQSIYKKFDCFDVLNAEYEKRITCQISICCLFNQNIGEAGAQLSASAVKIERYISALNECVGFVEIELGRPKFFRATLYENKVYIYGGEIDDVAQKSVSVLKQLLLRRFRYSFLLVSNSCRYRCSIWFQAKRGFCQKWLLLALDSHRFWSANAFMYLVDAMG